MKVAAPKSTQDVEVHLDARTVPKQETTPRRWRAGSRQATAILPISHPRLYVAGLVKPTAPITVDLVRISPYRRPYRHVGVRFRAAGHRANCSTDREMGNR